ncbi:MAG: ExeA family protein [Rubrivivax sp.]
MYLQHFGFQREPFSIAPDPRSLYLGEGHGEALAHLFYAVTCGGFVLLTGEIGSGKTTLCRAFIEQAPRRCNIALVLNPSQQPQELLRTVCEELRVPVPEEPGTKALVDALNAFLLRTHAVGHRNLVIVDEAQALPVASLEQLRLLTNLETAEGKLLQVILIGQPELREMLTRPEMEQVSQRIVARFHLRALDAGQTSLYVQHRLQSAGRDPAGIFDEPALARVHALTRGVPRLVNVLCDRALLGAFAAGRWAVDAELIDRAAREVLGPWHVRGLAWLGRHRTRLTWAGVGLAAGILVALAWVGRGRG